MMISKEKQWGIKMGSLKPGVKLIYEKADGVTYVREFGANPETRKEIGWDYDPRTNDGRPLHDHILEDKLWGDIRREAKTNPTLQQALDRVKILYQLSKTDAE
jgi:hypothetical protein